jgi:outer membrane lipoprotein-sorting protein
VGTLVLGLEAGNMATAGKDPAVSANIQDYVAEKLEDFTATMRVTFYDENAARKISKDFGTMYKIKGDILIRYKEPNKMRVDGQIGASKATLINNGSKQVVRISIGINTKDDLGPSPGKRKTLLDAGMLSADYLTYTVAEFRGERPFEGVKCAVFRVSYKDKNLDTSHRMIWIDPKTRVTLKREEYSQEGKLNAIYLYKEPKEVAPGVWFPSAIEVYNNQNQKSGTTTYRSVKTNQGLSDSLFQ